jgi:hypothetical protein
MLMLLLAGGNQRSIGPSRCRGTQAVGNQTPAIAADR